MNHLPNSVPEATAKSKIYRPFTGEEGESEHQTFNKRFAAVFGADLTDSVERLFSSSWHVCTDVCCSLEAKTVTELMCAKEWIQQLEGLFTA